MIYRGPNMNPVVVERLIETAERAKMAYQWRPAAVPPAPMPTRSKSARGGVATGLVSIPNRYMHSAVEMISLDDIDQAADLLANSPWELKRTPILRRQSNSLRYRL